ncbi:hypothetical protein [Aporhodopirellula aestuarii]|uniref:Uncharacterized protein n=1 Tax=Aporhodopirellula aestuarii TaxID=2950107 RepID=A0ABT0UDS4_9BACT|nr:hypothetical protein [Aporhodopirellula aestuarii]MCM2374441.1 hypothetical protein [Aporhodopirellula aestuarii]
MSRIAFWILVAAGILFLRPMWLRQWQYEQQIPLPRPTIEWVSPGPYPVIDRDSPNGLIPRDTHLLDAEESMLTEVHY